MTALSRYNVIKASAGAGKTFRLSGAYIRLLAEGAEPGAILATTFTRMAAAEILDRILRRLASGATDDAKAAKLGREIGLDDFSSAACRSLLARLCRSLDLVQVGTLDSFFGRVARGLRHAIGLPREPRMMDDKSTEAVRLRVRAFEEVLDREEPERAETLIDDLLGRKAQARISSLSDEELGEVYELYRETTSAEWDVKVRGRRLDDATLAKHIADLRAVAEGAETASLKLAMRQDAERFEAGDWEGALEVGIVKVLAAGGQQYKSRELDPAVRDRIYSPLVGHVCACVTGKLRGRVTAARELLGRLHEAYLRLRRDEGIVLYADVPHALKEVVAERPEILLAHFGGVTHVLFDEFQDVSGPQYRILRPLAARAREEAGKGRGSVFAVGDAKQSIFGWRGGLPRIFEHLASDLSIPAEAITTEAVNYRSAPVILETVNRLFTGLETNAALAKSITAAERWSRRFERHEACAENREMTGYAELRAARLDSDPGGVRTDEDGVSGLLLSAVAMVEEALESDPGREIAVLCRTNAACRTVTTLLKNRGIAALGEGGMSLADDPAVGVVLSALELADHPTETASAFHLRHSPLGKVLGMRSASEEKAAEVSLALRRRFLDEGYATVIAEWVKVLSRSCDASSLARLERLLRVVETAGAEELLRPRLFAERIRTSTVPTAESSAVIVTTIHRAKGREYEMVVYPASAGELIGSISRKSFIPARSAETDEVVAVFPRPTEKQRPLLPEATAACVEEETRQAEEDLCAVYVALTRAKRELRVLVPALTKGANGRPGTKGLSNPSVATLLRAGLKDEDVKEGYGGDEVLWSAGRPEWWKGRRRAAVAEPGQPVRLTGIASDGAPTRMRPRVSPSKLHGEGRVPAARLFEAKGSEAALRGTVLHEWFSRIGWLAGEDAAPGAGELAAVARQVEPSLSDAAIAGMEKDFRAALARPEIARVFARPKGEVEVLPEFPFAVTLGERFVSGRFDRVVITGSLDAPRSATIYDFKTDDVSGSLVEARAEYYRPQMEEYRRALAAMLGLALEKIEAALVFTTAGTCARV